MLDLTTVLLSHYTILSASKVCMRGAAGDLRSSRPCLCSVVLRLPSCIGHALTEYDDVSKSSLAARVCDMDKPLACNILRHISTAPSTIVAT